MSNTITLGSNPQRINLISKDDKTITLEERTQNVLNILEREKIALSENIEVINLIKQDCANLFWSTIEW